MLIQVFYFFWSGFDLNLLALNILVVEHQQLLFIAGLTTLLGEVPICEASTHAYESPFYRNDLGDLAIRNKIKASSNEIFHHIVSRHCLR